MDRYRIVATGALKKTRSLPQVRAALNQRFPNHPDRIERLLDGRAHVVAQGLPLARAERYVATLDQAGLMIRLEPEQTPALDLEPQDSAASQPEARVCPGCGYSTLDPEDPLISAYDGLGECPRCGIIPGKLLKSRITADASAPTPPLSVAGAGDDVHREDEVMEHAEPMIPATLGRRALAAILDNARLLMIVIPLILMLELAVFFLFGDEVVTSLKAQEAAVVWIIVGYLAILLSVFTFIHVFEATRLGVTWGQQRAGLELEAMRPERAIGMPTFVARALSWLAASKVLLPFLLIPALRKDQRTISDLISRTRLLQSAWPKPVRYGAPLAGLLIAGLVFALGQDGIKGLYESKSPAAQQQREAEAAAMRERLEARHEKRLQDSYADVQSWIHPAFARMQALYLKQYGRYSDTPETLLRHYGSQVLRPWERTIAWDYVTSGALVLTPTEQGFTVDILSEPQTPGHRPPGSRSLPKP